MDFIFIIGASGVGKTTLAKGLFAHYKGVYIEQNMVPEFGIPADIGDIGAFEEEVCWQNVILQLKYFRKKGFENIIATDFDDVRSRELPLIFKGCDHIIIRLVSSEPEQIKRQMIHRRDNEGGLFAPEYAERANGVIMKRPLLPNEVMIDTAGKSKEDILAEAVRIIDGFTPLTDHGYTLDDERNYLSWVRSRGLL